MAERLIPASAIERKLEQLKKERLDISNRIAELEFEQQEVLRAVEFYKSILDMAVEVRPGQPTPPPAPRPLPPSEAILNLVGEQPGITRAEVVEKLEGKVDTTSDDVPHLIRNTIYNLIRRGNKLVLKDERLFPAEQGPESRNGSSGPKS